VIKKSVKGVAKAMPEPVPTWLLRGRRKWWQMRAPAEPVEASPPSTMTSESTDESDEEAGRTGLRLSPSPGFDASFYMKFLEDPGHADASPFEHYLEIGVRAGLPPTRAALGKAAFEMSPVRGDPVVARPLSLRTLGGQDRVIRHLSQLPLESYDLVTVDFWQTLVVRNRPAESVKLESARFLAQHLLSQGKITARQHYEARLDAESRLATERKSAAGWGEYHAREALTLGIQSLVPELSEPALHEAVEATLEHEISSEIRYASLNPELAGWLSQIGANGPEVAVLSDFYLDSATLGRILASAGLEGPVPVVVSCEAGVSKAAGGQLFIDVRERFGVPADRHLHVGDNEHSDVAMQLATGGTAVLVPPPGAETEARGGPLHADEVARMFRVAVDSQPTPGPSPKVDDIHNQRDLHEHLMSRAYRAGWHFSALPTLLTVAAMERARRDGLDRVNYVSREGALLRRVHDVISDEIGVPEIRAVHLPSSRQATFAPSLDGTNDDLARMWTFYRHQSPNDFLASLGLEPSQFRTRLVAHGLEPEARIWSIWEEPAFAAFLEHKSVRSEIERALVNQRAKAEAFLAPALGDDKRSIVVDTGWRGTIQDNIARLFPDREFHGIYLGLLAFLNEQPENSTKSALGPDANSGDDVGWLEPHVGVIERLFSPPIGSTITYAGKKGLILGDGTARSALLDAFQDGVVAGASRVANAYLALGSEVADLKEAATDLMRSLVLQPNPGAADAFFSSAHSDDFGGGGLDTSVALSLALERVALRIAQGAQPPDLDDLFWSAGLRRCFAVEVALTGWW
jgi:FMN phosphatase YigB (HAD superfamily)